jgi:hypothetical protein
MGRSLDRPLRVFLAAALPLTAWLLLEVAAQTARRGQRVLYVSGEESAAQVRLRADRTGGVRDGLAVLEPLVAQFDLPTDNPYTFLVPGLLGLNLMGGGMWGVGFVLVDMRVRKLLKRFLATPMKKTDFLMGIMFSRMLFMVPEVLILLIFARYAFTVLPVRLSGQLPGCIIP